MANHPFGGILSAALSLISRSVGVTDHSALRSPDFPLADKSASDRLTNSCVLFKFRVFNEYSNTPSSNIMRIFHCGTRFEANEFFSGVSPEWAAHL